MQKDVENPQESASSRDVKRMKSPTTPVSFSFFLSDYYKQKIKYIRVDACKEDSVNDDKSVKNNGFPTTVIHAKRFKIRRNCTIEFLVIICGIALIYFFYAVVICSKYFYNPESHFSKERMVQKEDFWTQEVSRNRAHYEAMIPDFSDISQFIMTEVKLAYMSVDQANFTNINVAQEGEGPYLNPTMSDFSGELSLAEVSLVDTGENSGSTSNAQNIGTLPISQDEDKLQYQNTLNMSTSGIIQLTQKEDRFQYPINMLRDLNEWPVSSSDVLYFWHIPKTAGTSLKHVLEFCYGLIRAEKYREPQSLEVLYKGKHRFVNVGTDTPTAIIEARKIKLVESGIVQTIATSFFYEGSFLFTSDHKGRMVTLLRHPVERAHSLFHYLAQATWEPTYDPILAGMSFLDYGRSNRVEDNWIVRYLTNRKTGPLSYYYVDLATEVLRTKCLVGFMDYFEESVRRIEKYYGFLENKPGCTDYYIDTPVNKFPHPAIEVGSVEWNLFARINKYDVKLYENAQRVFIEQGVMLGSFIE